MKVHSWLVVLPLLGVCAWFFDSCMTIAPLWSMSLWIDLIRVPLSRILHLNSTWLCSVDQGQYLPWLLPKCLVSNSCYVVVSFWPWNGRCCLPLPSGIVAMLHTHCISILPHYRCLCHIFTGSWSFRLRSCIALHVWVFDIYLVIPGCPRLARDEDRNPRRVESLLVESDFFDETLLH